MPRLENGSRVVVAGGGPAGSFFAIHLLREAEQASRKISVCIVDKKIARTGEVSSSPLKGCNYCAGAVFPRLHDEMVRIGLRPPPDLVCEEFTHIWIHGMWKNFPLKVPKGQKLYSVFRGTLPKDKSEADCGFDNFLLREAEARGATLVPGEAYRVERGSSGKPVLRIRTSSEKEVAMESDFLALCPGINSSLSKAFDDNPLLQSFARLAPSFAPPKTRPTLIFELKPGRDYLRRHMHRELYFIVSGTRDLRLDHIALAPKGEYLTVALVGKSIDRARLPDDAGRIVKAFLALPHVRSILPGIDAENTPISCMCTPRMAVRPARFPFADRIGVAGDLLGARLYRDGLYSAFVSARALAETAVRKGVDRKDLERGCGPVLTWLENDNKYGRIVFDLFQAVLKSPLPSRVFYQTFATEMKFKRMEEWNLGNVLRKTASGVSEYEGLFRQLASPPVIRSVFRGMAKTARNILTEWAFGLSWEAFGRYPTVILKEKRDFFKESISAPLGIALPAAPEMERMYAIKIRASSRRIFEELGKFGEQDAKFLKLRFVDVERIAGHRNRQGAVVRYKLKGFPLAMDIRLIRSIPGRSLYYEPGELFAENGRLIFDIAPTKDGNNRLVIYTAFDFKKGRGPMGKAFWKLFKALFPEFAHDVVWNHAICRVKGEAEKEGSETG